MGRDCQTKADKLRLLFSQGFSTRDAAEIVHTTPRHARRVREGMRAISAGMTLRQEVSRLRQDLSDLRRLTLAHLEQSRRLGESLENYDHSDPRLVPPKTKPGKLRRVV